MGDSPLGGLATPPKISGEVSKVLGEGVQAGGGQNSPTKNLSHPKNSNISQCSLGNQNFASPQDSRVSPVRYQVPPRPRGKIAMLLIIPIKFSSGKCVELEFLIDTGSEMNLIRKIHVPEISWKPSPRKMNFFTASGARLGGVTHL